MVKKIIKDYSVITFGAVVAAAAIYFFMLPSHVAIGSGSALAMVLANFIPLPVSVISLSLNIIFLILGFILIGPEFGAKTVYTTILVPVSLGIFETLFPDFKSLTDDPLLDMVCYLLIVGIAMALLFSHNASSGGLDIVAKIMHKYLKMELGTAISVSGLAVALTTVFAYDSKTVVLSILGTYLSGIVVDKFIFGLNIKRRVCILSKEHMQEILDYILHDLHSGASLYDVIGAYDGVTRREILTIVDNNEYRKLMDFVKKTDPTAFVTVYSVNELRYQPKK
jgi:uncharacterized membrane-anchored protein YitT (DUF2179 family)